MWRMMRQDDLDTVLEIANQVHVGFGETLELFANRLELYPAGCYLAKSEGKALGYSIAFPCLSHKPPKLNEIWQSLPAHPDCFYWHDLCLLPTARGKGLGKTINQQMIKLAHGLNLKQLTLISIHNSAPFWVSQGFTQQQPAPTLVESYGCYAQFMTKQL